MYCKVRWEKSERKGIHDRVLSSACLGLGLDCDVYVVFLVFGLELVFWSWSLSSFWSPDLGSGLGLGLGDS